MSFSWIPLMKKALHTQARDAGHEVPVDAQCSMIYGPELAVFQEKETLASTHFHTDAALWKDGLFSVGGTFLLPSKHPIMSTDAYIVSLDISTGVHHVIHPLVLGRKVSPQSSRLTRTTSTQLSVSSNTSLMPSTRNSSTGSSFPFTNIAAETSKSHQKFGSDLSFVLGSAKEAFNSVRDDSVMEVGSTRLVSTADKTDLSGPSKSIISALPFSSAQTTDVSIEDSQDNFILEAGPTRETSKAEKEDLHDTSISIPSVLSILNTKTTNEVITTLQDDSIVETGPTRKASVIENSGLKRPSMSILSELSYSSAKTPIKTRDESIDKVGQASKVSGAAMEDLNGPTISILSALHECANRESPGTVSDHSPLLEPATGNSKDTAPSMSWLFIYSQHSISMLPKFSTGSLSTICKSLDLAGQKPVDKPRVLNEELDLAVSKQMMADLWNFVEREGTYDAQTQNGSSCREQGSETDLNFDDSTHEPEEEMSATKSELPRPTFPDNIKNPGAYLGNLIETESSKKTIPTVHESSETDPTTDESPVENAQDIEDPVSGFSGGENDFSDEEEAIETTLITDVFEHDRELQEPAPSFSTLYYNPPPPLYVQSIPGLLKTRLKDREIEDLIDALDILPCNLHGHAWSLYPELDLASTGQQMQWLENKIVTKCSTVDSLEYSPARMASHPYVPKSIREYARSDIDIEIENLIVSHGTPHFLAEAQVHWWGMLDSLRQTWAAIGHNRPVLEESNPSDVFRQMLGLASRATDTKAEGRAQAAIEDDESWPVNHHINFLGTWFHEKSGTSPAVSFWAITHGIWRTPLKDPISHNAVVSSQAAKRVDPVEYDGDASKIPLITGTEMQEWVTGRVNIVYRSRGAWLFDRYHEDEDVPQHICGNIIEAHFDERGYRVDYVGLPSPHEMNCLDGDIIVNDDGTGRPFSSEEKMKASGFYSRGGSPLRCEHVAPDRTVTSIRCWDANPLSTIFQNAPSLANTDKIKESVPRLKISRTSAFPPSGAPAMEPPIRKLSGAEAETEIVQSLDLKASITESLYIKGTSAIDDDEGCDKALPLHPEASSENAGVIEDVNSTASATGSEADDGNSSQVETDVGDCDAIEAHSPVHYESTKEFHEFTHESPVAECVTELEVECNRESEVKSKSLTVAVYPSETDGSRSGGALSQPEEITADQRSENDEWVDPFNLKIDKRRAQLKHLADYQRPSDETCRTNFENSTRKARSTLLANFKNPADPVVNGGSQVFAKLKPGEIHLETATPAEAAILQDLIVGAGFIIAILKIHGPDAVKQEALPDDDDLDDADEDQEFEPYSRESPMTARNDGRNISADRMFAAPEDGDFGSPVKGQGSWEQNTDGEWGSPHKAQAAPPLAYSVSSPTFPRFALKEDEKDMKRSVISSVRVYKDGPDNAESGEEIDFRTSSWQEIFDTPNATSIQPSTPLSRTQLEARHLLQAIFPVDSHLRIEDDASLPSLDDEEDEEETPRTSRNSPKPLTPIKEEGSEAGTPKQPSEKSASSKRDKFTKTDRHFRNLQLRTFNLVSSEENLSSSGKGTEALEEVTKEEQAGQAEVKRNGLRASATWNSITEIEECDQTAGADAPSRNNSVEPTESQPEPLSNENGKNETDPQKEKELKEVRQDHAKTSSLTDTGEAYNQHSHLSSLSTQASSIMDNPSSNDPSFGNDNPSGNDHPLRDDNLSGNDNSYRSDTSPGNSDPCGLYGGPEVDKSLDIDQWWTVNTPWRLADLAEGLAIRAVAMKIAQVIFEDTINGTVYLPQLTQGVDPFGPQMREVEVARNAWGGNRSDEQADLIEEIVEAAYTARNAEVARNREQEKADLKTVARQIRISEIDGAEEETGPEDSSRSSSYETSQVSEDPEQGIAVLDEQGEDMSDDDPGSEARGSSSESGFDIIAESTEHPSLRVPHTVDMEPIMDLLTDGAPPDCEEQAEDIQDDQEQGSEDARNKEPDFEAMDSRADEIQLFDALKEHPIVRIPRVFQHSEDEEPADRELGSEAMDMSTDEEVEIVNATMESPIVRLPRIGHAHPGVHLQDDGGGRNSDVEGQADNELGSKPRTSGESGLEVVEIATGHPYLKVPQAEDLERLRVRGGGLKGEDTESIGEDEDKGSENKEQVKAREFASLCALEAEDASEKATDVVEERRRILPETDEPNPQPSARPRSGPSSVQSQSTSDFNTTVVPSSSDHSPPGLLPIPAFGPTTTPPPCAATPPRVCPSYHHSTLSPEFTAPGPFTSPIEATTTDHTSALITADQGDRTLPSLLSGQLMAAGDVVQAENWRTFDPDIAMVLYQPPVRTGFFGRAVWGIGAAVIGWFWGSKEVVRDEMAR